ncbi:hypothetical protein A4X13_0g1538 [Tilletia indica]|uniref:polynucleotide adenylyltransferase n=1 Tax=Tilletia indica TaxID=43049 RepID=A0A177TNB9_9BASI|nr:hypothetical protein A4X13_0g1538 [Tilletia indica]
MAAANNEKTADRETPAGVLANGAPRVRDANTANALSNSVVSASARSISRGRQSATTTADAQRTPPRSSNKAANTVPSSASGSPQHGGKKLLPTAGNDDAQQLHSSSTIQPKDASAASTGVSRANSLSNGVGKTEKTNPGSSAATTKQTVAATTTTKSKPSATVSASEPVPGSSQSQSQSLAVSMTNPSSAPLSASNSSSTSPPSSSEQGPSGAGSSARSNLPASAHSLGPAPAPAPPSTHHDVTSARSFLGSTHAHSQGGGGGGAVLPASSSSTSYASAQASPSQESATSIPASSSGQSVSQQSIAAAHAQAQAALAALQHAQQQHAQIQAQAQAQAQAYAGYGHGHGTHHAQSQHGHGHGHHHYHQQQQQQQHHHHHHHQQGHGYHHHQQQQQHQHAGGVPSSAASASSSSHTSGAGAYQHPHSSSSAPSTALIGGPSTGATSSTAGASTAASGTTHAAAPSTPLITGTYAYERLTTELTSCIIGFLTPILPTEEEYRIKEATRRQLERLACRVSPGAKLLAFGSMANGFALRNSDMDLCCLLNKKEGQTEERSASVLVEILGQLIREETDFNVMMLPKARIPIIKISRVPSADLPYEISCDIGFENRLALENTRLLLSYAMVDPPRLRTLVLFLKVWTKRRKLNSPYTGTLSSYGYTLLVLFFLCHVKRPPILPNLQRIPPSRPLNPEEVELNGHNIYFYDDIATLRQEWSSQNTENVGELLIDFFRYFSKEFSYSRDVISLRTEGGLMSKDKDWTSELCIEDPFQLGYNVSRTVTKDGLYTIRGEFMRATRILLGNKHQRMSNLIAELCEEREDIISRAPDTPVKRHPSLGPGPRNSGGGGGPGGSSSIGGGGSIAGGAAGSHAGTGATGLGFGYHHATAGTLAATGAGLASPPTSSSSSAAAAAAAAAVAAVAAAAAGGTHAAGLIDPRIMRDYREFYDTPRRYDSSFASGLGGSFAFEEMARGLGLGQQGYRTVPAYPPTTAMLAPLSQNNGLAQRMVGSNYRGSSVSAGSGHGMGTGQTGGSSSGKSSSPGGHRGGASGSGAAGSSEGAGAGENVGGGGAMASSGASGKGAASGNVGAGVGIGISGVQTGNVDAYGYPADLSFANALNRSKSLPRPFIDDQRSSTPLRSEPASPKLGPNASQRTQQVRDYGPSTTFHALQPAMATLSVSGGALPRPPAPQRSHSGIVPTTSSATTSSAALANTGDSPSPTFSHAADGGTMSTPMSMSASAGPARYVGASGPPGSVAWPYGASSSAAAIAAAYAQAAALAAAGYPTSTAAYPYAASAAASSSAAAPHTSPMQYPQGFGYDVHPQGLQHGTHLLQLDPRSNTFALESSVGSLGAGAGDDVFGAVNGAPLIPGVGTGVGYGAGYVPGMGGISGMHGMGGQELGLGVGVNGPNGVMGEDGLNGDGLEDDDFEDERNGLDDASSDISEGTLDELARVSEMEAKEDNMSPAFESPPSLSTSRRSNARQSPPGQHGSLSSTTGPTGVAGSGSRGGKAATTTGVEDAVDVPASSPAIDIAPATRSGSRRQSVVANGK